jgi:hypothetical protein
MDDAEPGPMVDGARLYHEEENVMSDDHTGHDKGQDAGADVKPLDEATQDSSTKTQDLAKAGRKDFDPNEGSD